MSMAPIPPAVDTGFGGESEPPRINPLIANKKWGSKDEAVTSYNVFEKVRDCGWFVEYVFDNDNQRKTHEMPLDEFLDKYQSPKGWLR